MKSTKLSKRISSILTQIILLIYIKLIKVYLVIRYLNLKNIFRVLVKMAEYMNTVFTSFHEHTKITTKL